MTDRATTESPHTCARRAPRGESAGLIVAALVVTALFCAASCDDSKSVDLPPASGSGAAALPELPNVSPPARGGGGDGAHPGARGPLETTGTTFARAHAQVATKRSGVIHSLPIEEGQVVDKGQVLFRIDARDASLQRAQAQANVKAAQVQLDALKIEHDRVERLLANKAIPPADYDRVLAQYRAAQVAVEQAQVAVSMANQAIADATVRAPIGGTVTALPMNQGETVSATPATIVVELQDLGALELRFQLPEAHRGELAEGATLTARFAGGVERPAVVARISPTVNAATRTFEVVAMIDNADRALAPGMLAQIAFTPAAPSAPAAPVPAAPAAPATPR